MIKNTAQTDNTVLWIQPSVLL